MITRNTVSLVEVLQLKNPENLRSLGPLLFRVLPPQCQILKPLVPGHRGAGWGQGWALLPSGTLSISEGSWYLPGLYRFSWRDRSASRPRAGVRRAAGLVRPEGRGPPALERVGLAVSVPASDAPPHVTGGRGRCLTPAAAPLVYTGCIQSLLQHRPAPRLRQSHPGAPSGPLSPARGQGHCPAGLGGA